MKKLFITISLSTLLLTCFSQTKTPIQPMKAGDHLIWYTKEKNAALIIAGASILLALVPVLSEYNSKQAKPVYIAAGLGMVISFSLNISAIQQVGKAGKKLKQF